MNPLKIAAILGSCVLLTATAPAQHQHYDKATPPAKDGAAKTDEAQPDRPAPSSKTDRLTAAATRFKALDTDRDNRISRAEFTLAPNLGLQTGKGTGVTNKARDLEAVGVTDSNITVRQSSSPVALFNEIDTDNDGFLSQAELALHTGNDVPAPK